MAPSTAELVERMKDVAHELGVTRLVASLPTGPDSWRIIDVRHAAPFSDSPDGWDVRVTESAL